MTFSSLIPLICLVGIPIIIILYLLKPKGKRKVMPSLLLWRNAERNDKSMTFAKRLIRNILMLLEILALLLLMFALMSPSIKSGAAHNSRSTVIVLDNSGSMEFKDEAGGNTRFEAAVKDIKDYIQSSDGDVTLIVSGRDTEIISAATRDDIRVLRSLSKVRVTDASGDISQAESIIGSVKADRVMIFTDYAGATQLEEVAGRMKCDIKVYGEDTGNVSLYQMSVRENEEGLTDVAYGISNRSKAEVTFDVSIYDSEDNLLGVRNVKMQPDETKNFLLTGVNYNGSYIKGELSGISYSDNSKDGLEEDNVAYAVRNKESEISGFLVGNGNTYVEKAYKAYQGTDIVKAADDKTVDAGSVAIYDKGTSKTRNDISRIILKGEENVAGTLDGAVIDVETGELLSDLSRFEVGANDVNYYDVPEWAVPFMSTVDGEGETRYIGYYGEHDGIREVVIGFDIRDSEFPLLAEFPVFIADSINYTSDKSMIDNRYMNVGEAPMINAAVAGDYKIEMVSGKASQEELYDHAGLYKITSEDTEDFFVQRFPLSESDGLGEIEDVTYVENPDYGVRMNSLRRLCILIALIMVILNWIIYVKRNGFRRGLALYVRIALVLIMIGALLEIRLPGRRSKVATIFVVDMSDSNKNNLEKEEAYLQSTLQNMPSKDVFGIVTFGRDTVPDQFITDENEYLGIASIPDGSATDIESAVKNAAAMIPEDRIGRIVVLTDGKETLGDIRKCDDILKAQDIELCGVIYENLAVSDVFIESVDMPEKLAPGDTYSLKVVVYSALETDGKIVIGSGEEEKDSRDVHLQAGTNTFVFGMTAGDEIMEKNDVKIEVQGDAIEENNVYSTAALVETSPATLIISGKNQNSTGLGNVLETANENVEIVKPDRAPTDLTEMLQYGTIILDNVYLTDLPDGFLENIETFVKDYGGGLVACGGDESFGPGGYRKTVLEDILPVDMLPKGTDELPSLAMVMVIDCSGSMSGDGSSNRSKIDVAVDAAKEGVATLTSNDYVGVLTFSDNYEWRQPITKCDDKKEIQDAIEEIGIQGGTVLKPGLTEAVQRLSTQDAGLKHIVLLTDGECETTDFNDVVEMIKTNGITMSTVAVGSDSDTKLMEQLARDCHGRYYYADENTDVPKIFATEVYLSGDTYFKEGDFALALRSSHKLVSDLYTDGMPHIEGYVAVSMKKGATEVISSAEEEEPILATWQYGLGKTVAWTTNSAGTWDKALSEDEYYPELWKRIVDYTQRDSKLGQDYMNVSVRKEQVNVSYTAKDYTEDTHITGIYSTPDGETHEVEFNSSEPGNFNTSFNPGAQGVYNINVVRYEGDTVAGYTSALATVQFLEEYKVDNSNDNFVSYVEKEGRIITEDEKLFTALKTKNRKRHNITILLLIISILLLIFDIIVRRFGLELHLPAKREKKVVVQQTYTEENESAVTKLRKRRSDLEDKAKKPADVPPVQGQVQGQMPQRPAQGQPQQRSAQGQPQQRPPQSSQQYQQPQRPPQGQPQQNSLHGLASQKAAQNQQRAAMQQQYQQRPAQSSQQYQQPQRPAQGQPQQRPPQGQPQRGKKQQRDMLDTSVLLKKKNERNIDKK